MTQNQPASEARHHVLCETDKFRHWLNELSESSARALERQHAPSASRTSQTLTKTRRFPLCCAPRSWGLTAAIYAAGVRPQTRRGHRPTQPIYQGQGVTRGRVSCCYCCRCGSFSDGNARTAQTGVSGVDAWIPRLGAPGAATNRRSPRQSRAACTGQPGLQRRYRACMADDGPIQAIKTFLHQNPPEEIDIPDSVGDAEAVHAVVEQYDEAGLECTEEHAEEIVREARSS
jgi:hypothetical protein